jgi:hypothetical protein
MKTPGTANNGNQMYKYAKKLLRYGLLLALDMVAFNG